jgi:hypothetical protein
MVAALEGDFPELVEKFDRLAGATVARYGRDSGNFRKTNNKFLSTG